MVACDYGNVYADDSRLCEFAKYGQEAYELYSSKNLTPNCDRVKLIATNLFQRPCVAVGCAIYLRDEVLNYDEFDKRICIAREVARNFYNLGRIWQVESFVEAMANVYTYTTMNKCSDYTLMWGTYRLYKVSPDKYAPDYSAGSAVYAFSGAYWSQLHYANSWNVSPDVAYMSALMQLINGVPICGGVIRVGTSDADYVLDENKPVASIRAEKLMAYIVLSKDGDIKIDNTKDCRMSYTALSDKEVLAVVACYNDADVTVSISGAQQPSQPPEVSLQNKYVIQTHTVNIMPLSCGPRSTALMVVRIPTVERITVYWGLGPDECGGGVLYLVMFDGWRSKEEVHLDLLLSKYKVVHLVISEPIL